MSGAATALRNEPLARWLTVDVPWAIVAGETVPPRPGQARPRKRLFGR